MRIIGGTARGRRLAAFPGKHIRPTSDRVREALFSILANRLGSFEGRTVLDLFAGTGAMALEALSRGAAAAVLVERDREAVDLIRRNVRSCGLEERAEVIPGDARKSLPSLYGRGPFDLIFLDPPYGRDPVLPLLEKISMGGLLAPGGMLCLEAGRSEELPEQAPGLVAADTRRYGKTVIRLYTNAGMETVTS